VTLLAESWNVQAGWRYLPVGTLVFDEIGRPAQ
jgi:hypothetical protein